MRRIDTLLLAVATALLVPGDVKMATAGSPADIVLDNTPAILFLQVVNPDGSVVETGTGFIVSHDGYVVTVAHLRPDPTQSLQAVIGQRAGTRFPLEFREIDEDNDVALWQLPQSIACRTSVVISPTPVKVFDRILAVGFPRTEGLSPSVMSIKNVHADHGFYSTDGFLEPGNSGGPVFDEKGQVIAVVEGGGRPGTQDNDIVPIALALNLTNKRNVAIGIGQAKPFEEQCYALCRTPAHGVETWQTSNPWKGQTGRLPGGSGQDAECAIVKAAALASHPGAIIDITATSETSQRDLLGQVTYQYFCEGVMKENPVYVEKRAPDCGMWN